MRLYYFNMIGRAESIKLLLNHARVPFKDAKISFQDWPKYKNEFELQQLPVLEHKGERYCQSIAILEYLGAKYGYLPKHNCNDLYKVMHVVRTLEDVFSKAFLTTSNYSPLSAEAKAKELEQLITTEGPLFVGAIEKQLKSNCTQEFIVGDKYTIADFNILGAYKGMLENEPLKTIFAQRLYDKYPTLWKYAEKRMKDFNPYYGLCKNKLYYFDAAGRGEMIRLALKYLKVPFEDVRINFKDWGKEKFSGKFELQQLPVFECEPCGLKLSQSDAIMHYIGTKYRLLPMKNPEKLHKVLWWCNTAKDVMEACFKVFLPVTQEKKNELLGDFFTKSAPVIFKAMETRLKRNESQNYLVGSRNTLADFYLLGMWKASVDDPDYPLFKGVVENCPVLCNYIKRKSESLQ